MPYRVVSRFFDRVSGRYIDPGQECPPLSVDAGKRLVRARCLVEVPDEPPAPASKKPRAPQGSSAPPRQEAPPPPRE